MIHNMPVWFRYVKPIQTNLKTIGIQYTDLCKRIAAWSNQMIGGSGQDSDAVDEMTDICWHTVHHYNTGLWSYTAPRDTLHFSSMLWQVYRHTV